MTTTLAMPDDIYPGPVLPSTLAELKAVAQEFGANILEIPRDTPVLLELIGPATIILACPAEVDLGVGGREACTERDDINVARSKWRNNT